MTKHCWTVRFGQGRWDRAYVEAEDEASALAACYPKTGHVGLTAERTFPWVTDTLAPDRSDNVVPVEHGSRQADGTVGLAHPRTREVLDWLKAYEGRNNFVQDVRFKVENGRQYNGRNAGGKKAYKLSAKQVEALAKVKDREAEAAKQRQQRGTGLNVWGAVPYGTTYAAAENERGSLSFVRIDKVERGNWADWVFVRAVVGGNEDMRLGSQRPDSGEYVGQWPVVLQNVCADVVAAVSRYGLELGVCGVCNRALTNEESRRLGIGPVCLGRLRGAA